MGIKKFGKRKLAPFAENLLFFNLGYKTLFKILEIDDFKKENLENFLKENSGSLLQSWDWGEFQKTLGRKIWRFGLGDGNLRASALIVKYNLPFGKCYFYCPRGPILNSQFPISNSQTILKLLVNKAKEIAKKENSIFFRIDPEVTLENKELISVLENLGFIKSKKETQPKDTLILDISKSENEILAQMHHKTRYNIGLARRKGVKIRQSIDLKDVDQFYNLMLKTSKRDKFFPHPKEYYKMQIDILGKQNLVRLFVAEILEAQNSKLEVQNPVPKTQNLKSKIQDAEVKVRMIAAAIVSFYGQRATYLHGASDYQFRNLMAPHLVQWEAILEAKRRGCRYYDFWGIEPKNCKIQKSLKQDWAGITRFKRGFARTSLGGLGKEVNYIGAWDLPIQKGWYWIYHLAR